jgi:hypothetical protein
VVKHPSRILYNQRQCPSATGFRLRPRLQEEIRKPGRRPVDYTIIPVMFLSVRISGGLPVFVAQQSVSQYTYIARSCTCTLRIIGLDLSGAVDAA